MDSTKKNIRAVIIFFSCAILTVLAITLVSFLVGSKKPSEAGYVKSVEEEFDYNPKSNSLLDITKELSNYELLINETSTEDFNQIPFSFRIVNDGILITDVTHKSFYDLGLEIGDIIIKINDVNLKSKNYNDTIRLLYQEKNMVLYTDNGKVITYQKPTDFRSFEVISIGDIAEIKIYNFDKLLYRTIYELTKNSEFVILDLNEATINDVSSFQNFLSLFKKGELFKYQNKGVYSYKEFSLNDKIVNIKAADTKSKGIKALVSILESYDLEGIYFDKYFDTKEYKVLEQDYFEKYTLTFRKNAITWGDNSGHQSGQDI